MCILQLVGDIMSETIDTPYGKYTPQVPTEDEMREAAAMLSDAVETIAEVNHDMWAATRIADGWAYGEQRDDAKKLHPDLLPYARLSEGERKYDRETAKAIVAELKRRGILGSKE